MSHASHTQTGSNHAAVCVLCSPDVTSVTSGGVRRPPVLSLLRTKPAVFVFLFVSDLLLFSLLLSDRNQDRS